MKKFPLYLALVALVSLMGCQSEGGSSNDNPYDTTSTVQIEPTTYELSFLLNADQSWQVKDKRMEIVTLRPGEKGENVSKTSTIITRKFNAKEMDRDQLIPITVTYKHVYGEGGGEEGKFLYDSNDPQSGPGNGLEYLMETQLDFRIAPATGQLVDLVGGDDLIERMTGGTGMQDFGNNMMKEQLSPDFFFMPENPVAEGASWQRTGRISSRYNVSYTSTYSLESISAEEVVISQETEIIPLPEAEANLSTGENGEGIRHELTGTSSGEFTLNRNSGLVMLRSSTTQMEGERLLIGKDGVVTERIPIQIDIERYAETK